MRNRKYSAASKPHTSKLEQIEWEIKEMSERQVSLRKDVRDLLHVQGELEELKKDMVRYKDAVIEEQKRLILFWKDKAKRVETTTDLSSMNENVKHWRDLAVKAKEEALFAKLDNIRVVISLQANRRDLHSRHFMGIFCLHLDRFLIIYE